MAGILTGLIGVVLLFGEGAMSVGSPESIFGMILLLIAVSSWSIGSIYSRYAPLPKSTFLSGAMKMLSAGVMFCIASIMSGELHDFDFHISMLSTCSLAFLTFFGSIIAFSAYIWLLKHTSTAVASTYAFVNPVVAVFLGWFLADEQFTSRILFASIIIIISVALITLFGPEKDKQTMGSIGEQELRETA
ncbi:EamA family transporter [candidate division KSB1 bacterium]